MPWDTLGDMFSQTGLAVDSANAAANPPQAPEPQQQINTGSWTDMFQPPSPRAAQLVGTFGNIALGGLAAGAGQFPQFQRQQMAWQEMALRQQEQAIRDKQQAAQMAGSLADIMHSAPGYRKDLITAYARAAGIDPKDPNIQEIASLASKMDTQDAQGMAEALRMLGVQVDNPGQLFSALKDPALRVQFFKQLEANKQSATIDDIIKQYPPTPPPGSNNVTPQGAPLPGNEGQIPPTTAQMRLQYLNKEQQRLGQLFTAVSKAAPGSQMAKDINTAIDNVRAEIGQIQGQINIESARQDREQARQENQAFREMTHADLQAQRGFTQQMAMQAAAERQDLANQRPVPGVFADKSTGEIRSVNQGEFNANPQNFKRVSPQDATTVDLLKSAGPMLDQLEVTTQKVLAKYKGQHLSKIMQNYSKGKLGIDPDVAELNQLGTAISVELTRALAGSSRPALALFHAIQGAETPGVTVTSEVAQRMISNTRASINNRINSITGQPLQPIREQAQQPQAQMPSGVTVRRVK